MALKNKIMTNQELVAKAEFLYPKGTKYWPIGVDRRHKHPGICVIKNNYRFRDGFRLHKMDDDAIGEIRIEGGIGWLCKKTKQKLDITSPRWDGQWGIEWAEVVSRPEQYVEVIDPKGTYTNKGGATTIGLYAIRGKYKVLDRLYISSNSCYKIQNVNNDIFFIKPKGCVESSKSKFKTIEPKTDVLPKKWFIQVNEDNQKDIATWRGAGGCRAGLYCMSCWGSLKGYIVLEKTSSLLKGYKEISTEQFREHVLKTPVIPKFEVDAWYSGLGDSGEYIAKLSKFEKGKFRWKELILDGVHRFGGAGSGSGWLFSDNAVKITDLSEIEHLLPYGPKSKVVSCSDDSVISIHREQIRAAWPPLLGSKREQQELLEYKKHLTTRLDISTNSDQADMDQVIIRYDNEKAEDRNSFMRSYLGTDHIYRAHPFKSHPMSWNEAFSSTNDKSVMEKVRLTEITVKNRKKRVKIIY
jgi:hypothetical protein